jgi:hypothetical protein
MMIKTKPKYTPVLVAVVFGVSRYGAQLLAVAAQHLRIESVFSAATVTHGLHDRIDFHLEHLRQLSTHHNIR